MRVTLRLIVGTSVVSIVVFIFYFIQPKTKQNKKSGNYKTSYGTKVNRASILEQRF